MNSSSLDGVHKKHLGNKYRCRLRHSVRRMVYASCMSHTASTNYSRCTTRLVSI